MGGAVSNFVSSVVDPVVDVTKGAVDAVTEPFGGWSQVRDSLEGAAVAAGNYYLPGSGALTSKLVSEGAQEGLATGYGQAAMLGSGLAGGFSGNGSNYGSLASAAGKLLGGGGNQSLATNYLPSQNAYGTGNYLTNTAGQGDQQSLFAQMLPFLMATGGGLAQGQVNQQAAQTQADALRAAGQQAATASQFRPIGTTTRFGSSNFQVDPTTGQLVSAGYTPSALAQGYQNQLAGMTNQGLLQGQQLQGLASQYLGESPEAVRQRYVQQQSALLAPQQEQQLAGIRNNLFQTGRTGLATGATSAGGLAATNPEMAAYYNSLANQQRQIAAGADTAAQQQIQFGQQLAGQAYSPFTAGFGAQGAVETAAQQPFTMGQALGTSAATAGANAGRLGLAANMSAADAMLKANQVSPFADVMSALGKTPTATSALGGALGGLFGGGTTGQTGNVNIGGLGNIFSSDALNFGGWNSGGTSVYNPDAFSLGGNYGGATDTFNLGSVDQWWM